MSQTGNSELRAQGEPIVKRLGLCRQRLLAAAKDGEEVDGDDKAEWKAWTNGLPPIAFEVARETKELVQRVDVIDGAREDGNGDDDFS